MKLSEGMVVWVLLPMYGRRDSLHPLPWSRSVVTKVGRKYAIVTADNGRDFKFNINVWKYANDNLEQCVDADYLASIHQSKEKYEKLLKETQKVEKLISMFLSGHFKPTYEQAIKIAEIMNIEI